MFPQIENEIVDLKPFIPSPEVSERKATKEATEMKNSKTSDISEGAKKLPLSMPNLAFQKVTFPPETKAVTIKKKLAQSQI